MKINELVLKNRFVVEDGPVPPATEPAAPAATTTPAAAKPAAPAAKGPGFWDRMTKGANTFQAGIAGAKTGYADSQAQRAGIESAAKTASVLINRWSQAIGQDPSMNTPEQLQAFMTNSTKKSGITVPPAPPELNSVTTAKYITDVTSKSLAAARLGEPVAKAAVEPKPAATATAPAQPTASAEAPTASTTTPTSTDQAATQPKTYVSGTPVTPTNVTQQPSTVATKQNPDDLIANANSEDLEAMLAALQGTPG